MLPIYTPFRMTNRPIKACLELDNTKLRMVYCGRKLILAFAGRAHWVTCGRRHGKSFFDVSAALVGCGHVSGLLMRQV